MNKMQSAAGILPGLGRRPLLGAAVAAILAIGFYELLKLLPPPIPEWLSTIVAIGLIVGGLLLTLRYIRLPLGHEERTHGWTVPPALIFCGALILFLKFVSE
ncbi:MAG: hypothetical protein CVT77_09200 [Alphaproteobacteria bacterium HGW-Alphaproteobacteria-16]|nr:MAG: hypothetical protein CVT77_09200 [Alphaproteobacteria bacterium HGW-Alphaproteobacteria-16]